MNVSHCCLNSQEAFEYVSLVYIIQPLSNLQSLNRTSPFIMHLSYRSYQTVGDNGKCGDLADV